MSRNSWTVKKPYFLQDNSSMCFMFIDSSSIVGPRVLVSRSSHLGLAVSSLLSVFEGKLLKVRLLPLAERLAVLSPGRRGSRG